MNENNPERFPDSGLPVIVSNDEEVIRFLKQSKYFNSNGITEHAFQPRYMANKERSEVSVFRYQNEPKEYWKERNRNIFPNATIYGIAKLKVSDIRSIELEVEADDIPLAHGNIISWEKKSDLDLNKAYQKLLSKKLAQLAKKILYAA